MRDWKDVTQYSTAVVSIGSGIILSFLQYCSQGDLSNGVLTYVAQTLLFAGSVFGVTMYYNIKFGELKNMIKHEYSNMVSNSQKNAE